MAAMEWRSVHELRPRVSTSAGQSAVAEAMGARVADGVADAFGAFMVLAWAAHAEKALLEVHERQLCGSVSRKRFVFGGGGRISTYGFPSGPRTTPGGKRFVPGAGAVASVSICVSLACSAIVENSAQSVPGSLSVHFVSVGDALLEI